MLVRPLIKPRLFKECLDPLCMQSSPLPHVGRQKTVPVSGECRMKCGWCGLRELSSKGSPKSCQNICYLSIKLPTETIAVYVQIHWSSSGERGDCSLFCNRQLTLDYIHPDRAIVIWANTTDNNYVKMQQLIHKSKYTMHFFHQQLLSIIFRSHSYSA